MNLTLDTVFLIAEIALIAILVIAGIVITGLLIYGCIMTYHECKKDNTDKEQQRMVNEVQVQPQTQIRYPQITIV